MKMEEKGAREKQRMDEVYVHQETRLQEKKNNSEKWNSGVMMRRSDSQ